MVFQLTLIPHIGNGPLWPDTVNSLTENCATYWWSTLLYLQNYTNTATQCVGGAWYLCVDMQLYLFAPFILIQLKKRPNKTILYLLLAVIISVLVKTIITYNYVLKGLMYAFA